MRYEVNCTGSVTNSKLKALLEIVTVKKKRFVQLLMLKTRLSTGHPVGLNLCLELIFMVLYTLTTVISNIACAWGGGSILWGCFINQLTWIPGVILG